jgi:hypothetical protein
VIELAALDFRRGIFDGTAPDTATVVRLCKETPQKLWLEEADQGRRAHSSSLVGSLAWDAVAAMAGGIEGLQWLMWQ